MSILNFISEIVSSLAWPIAATTIVLVLKSEIAGLLKRVTRFKHGDSEVNFGKEVKEALNEAAQDPSIPVIQTNTKEQANLARLAEQSPRGAIIDAWLKIESAVQNYSFRHGVGNEHSKTPIDQIRSIEMHSLDAGALGKGIFQMLNKLRRLRNEAVHLADKEITVEVALEYIELANRVKNRLDEA